ncbi:leucine-rich repeat domain-containing protein [Aeoliella sp.]|uniref:leucine-rich repeat domain-containing protein n=1 Tax=Aeoliella sp. TaxID=2795800 RepID=UPI003CCC1F4E
MSRGKTILLFSLLAFVLAVPAGILWLYRSTIETVRDCYAQERLAEILIEHMERNQGAWPDSWDALAEAAEICEGRSGPTSANFEEIRELCIIEFEAVPAELVKAKSESDAEPPIGVVRLASGKERYWSGAEPNRMIYNYLQEAAKRPPDYRHPERPVESERRARQALLKHGARWTIDDAGHVVYLQMVSPEVAHKYTDDDLLLVGDFTELRELGVDSSNITDQGLQSLSKLRKLETLYLSGTQITDDGLSHLVDLDKLQTLTLAYNSITDEGLTHLRKLASLKTLNLNFTEITDHGVEELCCIHTLEEIQVGDTNITMEGARRLEAAFPDARIYHFAKPLE